MDKNVLIIGDFNSCTKEDSANKTEYNPKELGYIDLWKYYSNETSDRYTWYHPTGPGLRLDYAFVSPKYAATLEDVFTYQNTEIRESKLSDHSPLLISL